MSRVLKLIAQGASAGCLLSALTMPLLADTPSKTSPKTGATKTGAAKKPAATRQVQATDDEVEAPRPRAKGRPATAPQDQNFDEAAAGGQLPRPEVQPLRIQKLSPELEQILIDWETQSSKFKKLAGAFKRYRYDSTFAIEYRADGEFAYEAPDKGYYRLESTSIPKGTVSRKKSDDGEPFELKPDDPQRWVCTGEEVLKISEQEKQYEKVPIPEEHRGQNIIDGPLPFLFGMKAEQAKRRYIFQKMEPTTKEYKDAIWLKVLPRRREDAANWREARLMLDKDKFLPIAVALVHPDGAETVHRFLEIEINAGNKIKNLLVGNPFKPSLRGYKQVILESSASPTNDEPAPIPTVPTSRGGKPSQPGRASISDTPDRDLPRSADAGAPKRKTPATRNN